MYIVHTRGARSEMARANADHLPRLCGEVFHLLQYMFVQDALSVNSGLVHHGKNMVLTAHAGGARSCKASYPNAIQ
jgi:hypothetical protein